MSLNVLTQGGGTGGASASIFVTGLSEADTVTATKDGKTVKGKWIQRRIVPEGYTVLEYIESTRTQYIDTGYIPNPDTTMEAELLMTGTFTATPDGQLFGVGEENAAYVMNFGSGAGHANGVFPWFNTTYDSGATIEAFEITDEIRTNRNVLSVNIGSVEWGSVTATVTTKTTTHTQSLLLFGCKWQGVNNPFKSYNMRVFAWKIYDDNNLVRNFIPCTNPSGEVGLYDLVNGVFYGNAGTGTFVAGAEIPSTIDGHTITIKDYGMWTVTASNGEDTAMKDVLVDAAVEFEVEMSYYTYLYNLGDECEDLTGGWTAVAFKYTDSLQALAPTVTRNEDNLVGYMGTHYKGGVLCCANPIDLTNVEKLYFTGILATVNADGVGYIRLCVWSEFGTAWTKNIKAELSALGKNGEYEFNNEEIDVSSLTGEHRIGFGYYGPVGTGYYTKSTMYVLKMQ